MSRPLSRERSTYFPQGYPSRSYYMGRFGRTGDHVAPLRYDALECFATSGSYPNGNAFYIDAPNTTSVYDFLVYDGVPPWSRPAANQCYGELKEAIVGSTADLGTALAEWESSLGMIAGRASQLAQSASALRRRNFADLLDVWRAGPHRRGTPEHGQARKAADLWLEYSFGWKPLLADIKNGCDQISEPPPKPRKSYGSASDSNVHYSVSGGITRNFHANVTHRMGAESELVNPNLYLASQLGLTNPLATAWELIPGSFVADWMFDISSFLGSMSDFMGMQITNAYRSSYLSFSDGWTPGTGISAVVQGWAMTRRPGLYQPLPNLEFRRNVGTSLNRAANAVALATQVLTRHKPIA